jgi:uncharacterized protein YabE (DUF348 family)
MIPLAKNIKRFFSLKEVLIVTLVVIVSVSVGVIVFQNLHKEVVINDNGSQYVVKTMKTTVSEVLEQNGIKVKPYDYINLPLNSKLQRIKKNEINIKRAVPLRVLADGLNKTIMTYKDTVKEALIDNSVILSASDKLVGARPDDKITSGMDLRVIRVSEKVLSRKMPIPFKVVKRPNHKMDEGVQRVARQGESGVREKLYKVVLEDGKEVARNLVKNAVVLSPIAKIIEYGTVANFRTSRGDDVRYKKVLIMKATSYTASYDDTGKRPGDSGFGVTASGARARKGVIAVDPRVIPLGTRVYIEGLGNTPDYGYAIAADTGGAIKGNIIDLYFESLSATRNWGVRRVKVYILVDG